MNHREPHGPAWAAPHRAKGIWHWGPAERAVLVFILGVLALTVLMVWLILSGRHGLAGFLLLGGALAGGAVAAVVLLVLSRIVFTINLRR
jgi:hypothetical protein